MMKEPRAVSALSALAHGHRLNVFRLLVREGPTGLAAGEIAERLELSPTSLSFHLKTLEHAGLIASTREGRFVLYAVDVEGMSQLLNYLTEDCCRGKPELCGSAVKKAKAVCK
jgi:ArsR family transcriptional regulator, arsenate/arsenite/antimonite-responsive transcriptional repressor